MQTMTCFEPPHLRTMLILIKHFRKLCLIYQPFNIEMGGGEGRLRNAVLHEFWWDKAFFFACLRAVHNNFCHDCNYMNYFITYTVIYILLLLISLCEIIIMHNLPLNEILLVILVFFFPKEILQEIVIKTLQGIRDFLQHAHISHTRFLKLCLQFVHWCLRLFLHKKLQLALVMHVTCNIIPQIQKTVFVPHDQLIFRGVASQSPIFEPGV